MRDAKSRFAESTQRAGSSRSPSDRSRTSATLGALALAIVAVLVVGTASASAATYGHTTVTAEFGTNGTSATSFSSSNIGNIVYQQANKRIYIQVPGSIYGFSNPSPGTFTPLGGSFPLSISGGGGDSDMAVYFGEQHLLHPRLEPGPRLQLDRHRALGLAGQQRIRDMRRRRGQHGYRLDWELQRGQSRQIQPFRRIVDRPGQHVWQSVQARDRPLEQRSVCRPLGRGYLQVHGRQRLHRNQKIR